MSKDDSIVHSVTTVKTVLTMHQHDCHPALFGSCEWIYVYSKRI